MKEMVIRITPSRLKLFVSFLIIIGLGYYTFHFYNQSNEYYEKYNSLLTGGTVPAENHANEKNTTADAAEEDASAADTAEDAAKAAADTSSSTDAAEETLSGKLDITLNTPVYKIEEVGDKEKAVISFLQFTVKNGIKNQQTLIVEFHAYDYDETDENKIAIRVTESVSLPTIKSGAKMTKKVTFPEDNKIKLYNIDKKKTIQLDFIDKAKYDETKERVVVGSIKQDLTIS